KKNLITRRIRIYPSPEQTLFFNKCFGASRVIYNKGVEFVNELIDELKEKITDNAKTGCIYINSDGQQCNHRFDGKEKYFCEEHKKEKNRWANYRVDTTLSYIRKNVMVNDKNLKRIDDWQKDIPYDTRQLILKDLSVAYRSAFTNKIRGNIKHFRLGFKTRKDVTQIYHINKKAITNEL